jgi:glycosyltransferase involved in cell wall biosynthesis
MLVKRAFRAAARRLHWARHYVARVVAPVRRFCFRLALGNHRTSAAIRWPDASRGERLVLSVWFALLRFHDVMLALMYTQGHRARSLRQLSNTFNPGRVLHVTASFDLGGTQTQIKNLCEGAKVEGLISHEAVEIFPEYNFLYRQGAFDPKRYAGRGFLGRLISRLVTNADTRSSQIIQVFKLIRDIRVVQPEIVVGWGHEISVVTFIAASLAGVRHIVFCIRTFNPSLGWTSPRMGRLLRAAHRRMVPHVSAIITNSTPLRQDYSAWLDVDAKAITVCPNGIDAAPATESEIAEARRVVRERYGIASDAVVLIHVGRFSAEKGQMSLMQANLALLRRYPEPRFVWLLCGDGATFEEVQRYVVEHRFSNVVFAGRVNGVRSHLMAADIFVMPSDFEGMPNAMMEAMAHGLPAVSTDRSGAVDVARDRVEALYYPPRDIPALVERLAFLLDEPGERRALGARARERMKEFSIDRALHTFERRLGALCSPSMRHELAHPRSADGA